VYLNPDQAETQNKPTQEIANQEQIAA
jgi:hypothetical protein